MSTQSLPRLANFWAKCLAWVRTDVGMAVCLTLLWQLVMTGAGYIIDTQLHLRTTGLFAAMPHDPFGHTLRWDAGWYLEIIHSDFYRHTSSQGAVFAFYPLYPVIVATVATMTGGLLSLQAASFTVNTLATIAIVTGLLKIARHFIPEPSSQRLVPLLFILSPAALFLHVFYSEAVFIAIGTWGYLFALKQRWGMMALCLMILTAARLPSVLFIALCGLEFLRTRQWRIKTVLSNTSLLWFFITPLGFIAYSIWCGLVRGDPFAMFHAYTAPDGWPYQVFNPNIFATIFHSIGGMFHAYGKHISASALAVDFILPLSALALLGITAAYALLRAKGKFVPLGIFNILAIVLFTLNNNIVSIHRYALACISIFIITAYIAAYHPYARRLIYVSLPVCFGLQLWLLALFVTGHFAG